MKPSSIIGIVVAIGLIAAGATMEGSNIMAVLNVPALLIVLGGTFGATMAGTNFHTIKSIPKLYKKALMSEPLDLVGRVKELVGYAEKARRDGLLALDEQLASVEDPFTRKGLQLVVDGTDPDLVAEVLETENAAMKKRHQAGVQPFDKAGGFAPTTEGHLGDDTLAERQLKAQLSVEEAQFRTMTMEGILSIQAGDNPRVLEEKLMAYVPPSQRPTGEEPSGAGAASPESERAAA